MTAEPPSEPIRRPYAELRDEINRLAAAGGGEIVISGPTAWMNDDGRRAVEFGRACRIYVGSGSSASDRHIDGVRIWTGDDEPTAPLISWA